MALSGRPQVEEIDARGVAPVIIKDPANGGTIDTTRSGICLLSSAGAAETRSLPDPQFIGQQIDLVHIVDNGDIVITAVSPINQTGNTILTATAVGGFARLVGKHNATDGWEWQLIVADTGMAASGP